MFPASTLRHCVEFSGALVRLGADTFLQSTLLIALGLLVGWVLRARGASVQSAVYRITLAVALACPLVAPLLATAGLPGWHVNLPMPVTSSRPLAAGNDPAPAARAAKIDAVRPVAELQGEMAPSSAMRPAVHVPSAASASGVPQPRAADRGISEARPLLDWPSFLACVMAAGWLLGTCVLTVRLLLSWRLAVELRRSASAADSQTASDCRALAQQMGVCPPLILRSPFTTSAALVGLFRPAILLPEEESAVGSSREILVHELAHLARGDLLWKLLGRVGTALFFFQPLQWLLVRRMIIAAEEVCDDYVLEFGCDRRSYARQLVEVAQRYQPAEAVGVGMISLRSWVGRRVVRILDSSRQLSVRASRRVVGLALAISLAATILAGLLGITWKQAGAAPAAGLTPPAAAQTPPAADGLKTAAARPGDRLVLRGQVLDADGKPVAGTRIYLSFSWGFSDEQPVPPAVRATTGPDGRFRFTLGKSEFDTSIPRYERGGEQKVDYENACRVVAMAEGYGPDWRPALNFDESGELHKHLVKAHPEAADFFDEKSQPLLRLVKDDVPLQGRIVDTAGRPVAGTKIGVTAIVRTNSGDLSGWLGALEKKNGDEVHARVEYVSHVHVDGTNYYMYNTLSVHQVPQLQTTSDADGRFRITGIGRERFVDLSIEGPRIESAIFVYARTRPGPTLVVPQCLPYFPARSTIYGATFEHVARPSVPLVGGVRDRETGKPLAGVKIQAHKLANSLAKEYEVAHFIHATTDAAGRYRLTGMPVGQGNELLVVPAADQPYLPSKKAVDIPGGKDSWQVDFPLQRGPLVRGKVTDAKTGAPLPNCWVDYYAFLDNPHCQSAPGFQGAYVYGMHTTDDKGRYTLVGLPGRGIIAVEALNDVRDRYPIGVGADKIPELAKAHGPFEQLAPAKLYASQCHAMAAVDLAEGVQGIVHDFQLDPGQTLTGMVVDPAGKPLARGYCYGSAAKVGWQLMDSDKFTVYAYHPGQPRRLSFIHLDRKLAGTCLVEGQQTAPLRVRLQPWGVITGRALDAGGTPLAGFKIPDVGANGPENGHLPTGLWQRGPDGRVERNDFVPVGGDGRFRIEGLAPGLKYAAWVWSDWPPSQENKGTRTGILFSNVTVEAGQTKDLGDVRVALPKRARAAQ